MGIVRCVLRVVRFGLLRDPVAMLNASDATRTVITHTSTIGGVITHTTYIVGRHTWILPSRRLQHIAASALAQYHRRCRGLTNRTWLAGSMPAQS